jgi:hypothetical protein
MKEDEVAEHVARMGEMRNTSKTYFVRPEGERPHGRPRRRFEDDITLYLKVIW